MDGKLGKKYLDNYGKKVKPLLNSYLDSKIRETTKINKYLAALLKHIKKLSLRGKRIRGALTTLGYEAAGGINHKEILKTSLFIELFHTGILIHDDFMDNDDFRRGVETIHKHFEFIGKKLSIKSSPSHFGNSMAINAGDIAHFLSFDILSNSNFPPQYVIEALNLYSKFITRVVYGQTIDITNISIKRKSKKDILSVLRYKTAEYTGSLPLLTGAILAGLTDQKRLKNYHNFGLAFGWAFQIQDDILGIYGKEEKLGKPVGSDLTEGKNTLLQLYLSRYGTQEQKAFQDKVLGNENIAKKDLLKMQKVLKDSGAYERVVNLGWKYVEMGKSLIPEITKDKKLQKTLESLLIYMMERVR